MTSPREQAMLRRLTVLMGHLAPQGQQSPEESYGAAKLPGKVKEQEAPFNKDGSKRTGDIVNKEGVTDAPMRINAAYCDLDLDGGEFKPVAGVTYLWAIRAKDSHLVVGVEEPSKMQAAFKFDPNDIVKAMQAKKRQQGEDVPPDNVLDGLGHPTLAIEFGPNGEALVGQARISGELEAHGGAWKINDHSGRYSAGRKEVVRFLVNAAEKFQGFGINVQFIQSKLEFDDQIKPLSDLKQAKL